MAGGTIPDRDLGFLDEDEGARVVATASILMVACTVFVGLRYYARYLNSMSWNAEDTIIPFAWLAEILLCIVGIGTSPLPITTRMTPH